MIRNSDLLVYQAIRLQTFLQSSPRETSERGRVILSSRSYIQGTNFTLIPEIDVLRVETAIKKAYATYQSLLIYERIYS